MKDKIKLEIANFCENCISHECCPEEECVLFRIEQLINRNEVKMDKEELNNIICQSSSDYEILDKAYKYIENLEKRISDGLDYIRNETSLNDEEITYLSRILDDDLEIEDEDL